jgi:serine-type D-Ala-D-Ala carboxypeptidase (penicillin-binding protein 5/6)
LHRTLYLAPIAFVLLLALGFQGLIERVLDDGGRVVATAKGPAALAPSPPLVAGAVLPSASAVPTVEKLPLAEASPTALLAISTRPPSTAVVPATAAAPTPTAVPSTPTGVPPTAMAVPATATATAGPAAPQRVGSEAPPKIGAREFVVIDGDSGAVLLEQSAHKRVAPASTTKIVTSLIALERNNLAEVVTASYDPSELIDSTLMWLQVGDKITLEDLLYGLMLPSGNDAALAIATHVGGSRQGFVDLMNRKTAELGLADSHWVNPHGLDAPGHYSSPYDMVQFARVGMRDPRFQALSAARVRTVHSGARTYDVYNLNRVLGQVPGADGVKIGFTDDAGRTIVASATRGGHRVYIGAFHSTDLVGDCKPLFEWAFKNFAWPTPGKPS